MGKPNRRWIIVRLPWLDSSLLTDCKGIRHAFSFTGVILCLVAIMSLPCEAARASTNLPNTKTSTANSPHQTPSPSVVVNVPQKNWIADFWPPLVAALVSGCVLLLFSVQLQKKLLRLSARLQMEVDTYFRFAERSMEAQFLLFKAQATRRVVTHPDWPSTAQALQDKEAAIRALSGPINSCFPIDSKIGELYSQFLELYIKLKRILINHNQWDQTQFERDQDRLNDLYAEVDFRMGRIIENDKPASTQDLKEWHKATRLRREEMHQWE